MAAGLRYGTSIAVRSCMSSGDFGAAGCTGFTAGRAGSCESCGDLCAISML
jgi:hypothetical protein